MTAETPDDLTPSERHQYLENYVPGKLSRGEIPRTPQQWRNASAYWRTIGRYGRAVERGVDMVFGLPANGWESNVPHRDAAGHLIYIDRHRDAAHSPTGRAQAMEIKSGQIHHERDMAQLVGYADLLAQGEEVRYLIRESIAQQLTPQMRDMMANLTAQYPGQFIVMTMKDRVFTRILEAGTRVVEREERAALAQTLENLPARSLGFFSVADLARDFADEVARAQADGTPMPIEQLRAIQDMLSAMASEQVKSLTDAQARDLRSLDVGFFRTQEAEKFLAGKALDVREQIFGAIDPVTEQLLNREREALDQASTRAIELAAAVQQQILTLEQSGLEQAVQAVANSLGNVQQMERAWYADQAASMSPQAQADLAAQVAREQATRDAEMVQRLAVAAEVAQQARALEQPDANDQRAPGQDPRGKEGPARDARDIGASIDAEARAAAAAELKREADKRAREVVDAAYAEHIADAEADRDARYRATQDQRQRDARDPAALDPEGRPDATGRTPIAPQQVNPARDRDQEAAELAAAQEAERQQQERASAEEAQAKAKAERAEAQRREIEERAAAQAAQTPPEKTELERLIELAHGGTPPGVVLPGMPERSPDVQRGGRQQREGRSRERER